MPADVLYNSDSSKCESSDCEEAATLNFYSVLPDGFGQKFMNYPKKVHVLEK